MSLQRWPDPFIRGLLRQDPQTGMVYMKVQNATWGSSVYVAVAGGSKGPRTLGAILNAGIIRRLVPVLA